MVLVSEFPGEDRGVMGVVTLEDVIEELIGEEIVDETDVFVDVSKHTKRVTPIAAFAHSFHRISSRHGRSRDNSSAADNTITSSGSPSHSVMPLNKATTPNPTSSTKVRIKPGAATVLSQEERIQGKKAARYGTMATSGTLLVDSDADITRTRKTSTALIEERVSVRADGDGGKVVISPVDESHDDHEDEDEERPLLKRDQHY
jgi:uncharacterized Zn-binding protein involved in type VI secretion